MKTSSLRMLAYALICCGLINLDYQRHKQNIVALSSTAVVLGIFLIVLSFNKKIAPRLNSRIFGVISLLISAIVLILQFINI